MPLESESVLPHTISIVQVKNGLQISKCSVRYINGSKLSAMILIFSLKIGMNDDRILWLNVGFRSFLSGFQICAVWKSFFFILSLLEDIEIVIVYQRNNIVTNCSYESNKNVCRWNNLPLAWKSPLPSSSTKAYIYGFWRQWGEFRTTCISSGLEMIIARVVPNQYLEGFSNRSLTLMSSL